MDEIDTHIRNQRTLSLPPSRWAETYAKRMAMLFGGVYLLARAYNSKKDDTVA